MLPLNVKIWFYRQPIGFRKQMDGLIFLVADTLKRDPTSGQLFIFRNKQADKLKMLYWEDDGFWMLLKRRETSCHKLPEKRDETMALSTQQLRWLLSSLDFTQQHRTQKTNLGSRI